MRRADHSSRGVLLSVVCPVNVVCSASVVCPVSVVAKPPEGRPCPGIGSKRYRRKGGTFFYKRRVKSTVVGSSHAVSIYSEKLCLCFMRERRHCLHT